MADRLQDFHGRFRPCFHTRTRDPSLHAFTYLRGLLIMAEERNYANIARRVSAIDDDGQNLQHFMSDSPWEAQAVFNQIQHEIQQRPEMHGGMLTLDESGDERAGDQSAGAARQYIGRLGKIEMGQVGVGLGYAHEDLWAMVAAELYLPKHWFDRDHAQLRRRLHVPAERTFETKTQSGLRLIGQAQANGLPFAVVGCDSFYGRDSKFRAELARNNLIYLAGVPANILVYLQQPTVVVEPGSGVAPKVQIAGTAVKVESLAEHADFPWTNVDIRWSERGPLSYPCAARRVWTVTEDNEVREEWLLLRREPDGKLSFSLSNASVETTLKQLAYWRSQRYFAERTFQDAKSEAGWDELEARKYRAWMHHAALTALALWFVALTKHDWARAYPRDSDLGAQLEIEVLPRLSMSNVCELLQAAMPLPQLTPEQAQRLIVKHFVNRAQSTRSRVKARLNNGDP